MEHIETSTVFIVGGLGIFFWSLFMILIICAGVMPKRRDKLQQQNQKILSLMAEKLGVDMKKVEKIIVDGEVYLD